jgi:hypothetical protein
VNYLDFLNLVEGGETTNVDFKIECHAFESSSLESEPAKAELAKDICAMANNRDGASFLIIGLADNGRDFKSVTNTRLTDDNVQAFCKEAISPPPRVTLMSLELPPSTGKHAGKRCVVIQVGPNAPHLFRLNKDFISPHAVSANRRYHFHKQDVWLRREATSDLAAPEEIIAFSQTSLGGKKPERAGIQAPSPVRRFIQRLLSGPDANPAAEVARRFLKLFNDHGVAETQIQQFLPQIALDKLHTQEALVGALTNDLLNQAAELFKIRREWLDGVDDRIYEYRSCYKDPQRFFEELASVKEEYDFFPVRALYTGRQLDGLDDREQPLALLLVEKLREIGEEEICRYIIFYDSWDWPHPPCRIQLKAITRVMDRVLHKVVPMYAVEPAILEEVREGKRIPRHCLRGSLLTEPSLKDYALSPEESRVDKECEELPAVLEYIKTHDLEAAASRKNWLKE